MGFPWFIILQYAYDRKGSSFNFKMKLYYTHILEIILIVYLKNWRMWINQQSEYLFMKSNALLNIGLLLETTFKMHAQNTR